MATTETRTGFRLPWSQDHTETDEPTGDAGPTTEGAAQGTERPDMIDTTTPVIDDTRQTQDPEASGSVAPVGASAFVTAAPVEALAPVAAPLARRPNKLMVDLAKAMQTAAAGARTETLDRFAIDTKAHIGSIAADAATGTADLRRQADEDVAGIRDWSKAEIARIREETENRISGRKSDLEGELADHAALTERRIARVQARVDAYEAEMAAFFEVVFAEEDPTKLAAMAQNLPEPPDFEDETAGVPAVHATTPVVTMQAHVVEPVEDTDTAFAAIAAAAHSAEVAEAAEAAAQAEIAEPATVIEPAAVEAPLTDPRIQALGLSPDAAAEAEAASFETTEDRSDDEEIPVIDDDALAARIASLVPDADLQQSQSKTDTVSTRVVVVGLVSVASIAGFKRHLGRVSGVQTVGVSSGPDGEFVFIVTHAPEIALRDAVATLPGFGARVTGETDEGLQVTARDPEADS